MRDKETRRLLMINIGLALILGILLIVVNICQANERPLYEQKIIPVKVAAQMGKTVKVEFSGLVVDSFVTNQKFAVKKESNYVLVTPKLAGGQAHLFVMLKDSSFFVLKLSEDPRAKYSSYSLKRGEGLFEW